jgi:hypothetical protein
MKKRKSFKSPINPNEVDIWQEIIAKTLAVRCHHLVKEEKRKILNKMAKLIKEEINYGK